MRDERKTLAPLCGCVVLCLCLRSQRIATLQGRQETEDGLRPDPRWAQHDQRDVVPVAKLPAGEQIRVLRKDGGVTTVKLSCGTDEECDSLQRSPRVQQLLRGSSRSPDLQRWSWRLSAKSCSSWAPASSSLSFSDKEDMSACEAGETILPALGSVSNPVEELDAAAGSPRLGCNENAE